MPAQALLFLIDGSSQMYRAYHAPIRTADGALLHNAQGRPTNAVYIFVTMLRKLLGEQKPEYIAASFDLPGRTFRDDLVADYKANRAPMPDELAGQIPMVHAACEALGVPILTSERYEADDVIGTLVEQAVLKGFDVAIVTMDKDFFQLVRDGVRVFNPRDEGTWYDAAGVKEKFGVAPDQVVDVMALMGDTIDNIKGVPGIGEKGAKELIGKYETLDNLIAHASELTPKRRETLLANVEAAHQSRELARIHVNVPVEFDPDAFRYRGSSRERCFAIFNDLGFRTIVAEYAPTAASVAKAYRIVNTEDGVRALAARLKAAGRVRVPRAARSALRDARRPSSAWRFRPRRATPTMCLPATGRSATRRRFRSKTALELLRPLFEDPAVVKVGHDLKFDAIVLARHGVRLAGLDLDTMIASYLRRRHAVEPIRSRSWRSSTRPTRRCPKKTCAAAGPRRCRSPTSRSRPRWTFACERADLAGQLAPILRDLLDRSSWPRSTARWSCR